MTGKKLWRYLWVLIFCLGFHSPVSADVDNEAVLKRLNDLTATIEAQQKEIETLKRALQEQQKSTDKARDVQKAEIQAAVKTETEKSEKSWRDQLPEWTRKIRISGDLRLRYERLWDRGMLNQDGTPGKQDPRDRGRVRVRLFLDAPITDEISTHFMVTTNMSTNHEATTTNFTFGEDFNDKGIYLARAYAEYAPSRLKGLKLGGGKFKKNFGSTPKEEISVSTRITGHPELIEDGVDEDFSIMAGVIDQEITEQSSIKISRARLPWLIAALFGGVFAALVIDQFASSLEKVIALTFFFPVVMAMGGNTGIQASSVVVRGLATGDISLVNIGKRLWMEMRVAFINGLICGLILGLIVGFWLGDYRLGCIITVALILIILISGVIGSAVPLALKKFNIDPALAAGPFVTTSNDILSLFIYLGLVTIFLRATA